MQGNGRFTLARKDWRSFMQQCWCWKGAWSRRYATSRSQSHYDVLGVTPAATQAEIKSAYYKLSMKYHPDKCTDEDAKGKFRSITESYEVLGNIKLKKLYDRGLLARARVQQPTEREPTDPTLKFYKSRERRHVVPVMRDGSTPIYDFDAWTKNHYSNTFQKQQFHRSEVKRKTEAQANNAAKSKEEMWTWTILIVIITSAVFLSEKDYDVVRTDEDPKD